MQDAVIVSAVRTAVGKAPRGTLSVMRPDELGAAAVQHIGKILVERVLGEGSITILDPDDGDLYRCAAVLRNDGRKLEVRGYVGLPLFGRTQVWERVE